MRFLKQTDNLAELLADRLKVSLEQGKRVLWLVSGGSNTLITVEAMDLIDEDLRQRLVIGQVDERFVPQDSPDCNWHQLIEAGFDTKHAKCLPMLSGQASLEAVASDYERVLGECLTDSDAVIGQFGIGADGHTAGLLPNSEAMDSSGLVVGYEAEDFARISLTPAAIGRIDLAMVFAFGDDKLQALNRLRTQEDTPSDLPAMLLGRIPEVLVYNDQIEGE